MPRVKTQSDVKLPKGFKRPAFAPAWKPERKGDSITGVLKASRSVSTTDRESGQKRRSTIFTIVTAEGPVGIWESAGLRDLHNVGEGEEVYIEYLGEKKIEGQASPMRLYAVGVRG